MKMNIPGAVAEFATDKAVDAVENKLNESKEIPETINIEMPLEVAKIFLSFAKQIDRTLALVFQNVDPYDNEKEQSR